MLMLVILAFLLLCASLTAAFLAYFCVLWFITGTTWSPNELRLPVKPTSEKGFSASELQKLPKMTGKDLVMGNECAVCLDDIGGEQQARLVPGCNHGFHLKCADAWLSKKSVCPVCRRELDPLFLNPSESNLC